MTFAIETLPDGSTRGRDPRTLDQDQFRQLGHEPKSPLRALRERCIDCCAGSPHEVRCCTAASCPAWPFRMGTNPWRSAPTPERLEVMRERGRALARNIGATLAVADESRASSERTEGGATLVAAEDFDVSALDRSRNR